MALTVPGYSGGYITGNGSEYTVSCTITNSTIPDWMKIFSNNSLTCNNNIPRVTLEYPIPTTQDTEYNKNTPYFGIGNIVTNDYTTDNIINVTGTLAYNNIAYTGTDGTYYWGLDPAAVKRSKFKSNLLVQVKSRACPIVGVSPEERKAIETLREVISESDYRKYVKHGFLMVRGSDGDLYQVYRDRSHTKVWHDGKIIEEVCVRIKDSNVPPTDNVIAFKTLIEIHAEGFKAMGNRFKSGDILNTTYNIAANNYVVEYREAA